ncbi:MAG: outer membrane protein assembly factor BamD [bacterium]
MSRAVRFLLLLILGAALGCENNSNKVANLYKSAERQINRGSYTTALDRFNRIAEDFRNTPYAPKALYYIGNIYNHYLGGKDGSYEDAIDTYHKLVVEYPESDESYWALERVAEIYMYVFKDYSQAILEYRRMIEEYPNNPDNPRILFTIGECLSSFNRFGEAIYEYRNVIERYPKSEYALRARFRIADNLYILGDYKAAAEEYKSAIKQMGDGAEAVEGLFWIASAYELQGNNQLALKTYRKIEKSYPNKIMIERGIERARRKLHLESQTLSPQPEAEAPPPAVQERPEEDTDHGIESIPVDSPSLSTEERSGN